MIYRLNKSQNGRIFTSWTFGVFKKKIWGTFVVVHQVDDCGSLRQKLHLWSCLIPHPSSFLHSASHSTVPHWFMLFYLFYSACSNRNVIKLTLHVYACSQYESSAKHNTQSNEVFISETLILWSLQMYFSYLQTLQRQWIQDVNSVLNSTASGEAAVAVWKRPGWTVAGTCSPQAWKSHLF